MCAAHSLPVCRRPISAALCSPVARASCTAVSSFIHSFTRVPCRSDSVHPPHPQQWPPSLPILPSIHVPARHGFIPFAFRPAHMNGQPHRRWDAPSMPATDFNQRRNRNRSTNRHDARSLRPQMGAHVHASAAVQLASANHLRSLSRLHDDELSCVLSFLLLMDLSQLVRCNRRFNAVAKKERSRGLHLEGGEHCAGAAVSSQPSRHVAASGEKYSVRGAVDSPHAAAAVRFASTDVAATPIFA